MAVLNSTLAQVIKYLQGETPVVPTTIILGTDGTAFDETQTGLIAPVGTTNKAFASTPSTTEFQIQYEHLLGLLEGNSISFRELALRGVLVGSTVHLTRNIFPVFDKTNEEQINSIIIVEVLNEQ